MAIEARRAETDTRALEPPDEDGEDGPPPWAEPGARIVSLIGDSGTGKSHLLIGIGTAITEAGLKVRYTTTANLVNELAEAADEKKLARAIARYGRVDLLCLDELGYLDLDKAGAKLLFQVFTEREERRAIAIASNAPFSKAHMFRRTCARRCRNSTGSLSLPRRHQLSSGPSPRAVVSSD